MGKKDSNGLTKTKSSKSSKSGKEKSLLQKEHEDDVHEALLCVLQSKRIPKEQLLKMAMYGGIENHVVSTLEKVRGCDTNADADLDDENDDDECKNDSSTTTKKKKKKRDDFYDPSILASPSVTPADNETSIADDIERDKLLFQEVIDLARGGIGGQYA